IVWTETSCFFAFSASIAVRSRSTVVSLRADVDCLIPASCASEYVRGKRGERRLVFGFIASLQRSVGRREHFEHRNIAACGFLFQLHTHDIDHVIEQLDLDPCLDLSACLISSRYRRASLESGNNCRSSSVLAPLGSRY